MPPPAPTDPVVYDRTTGQPVSNLNPDQLHQGLADGSLALDAKAPPVQLTNAQGQVFNAPVDKVQQALQSGAYRMLSAHEALQRQVSQEEQDKGTLGSVEEGARSFGNQALFGVPGIINDAMLSPEEKEKRDLIEDYHSTARTLGGIAGFGTSMLAGGELFKGAEIAGQAVERGILPAEQVAQASLAHSLASKAAGAATQGAIAASPQVLAQAAVGDPKQAAESLLWGIGGGIALGGAEQLMQAVGKGIQSVGDKVLSSDMAQEALDKVRTTSTFNVLGAERKYTNKLSTDRQGELVDFAHDTGLIQPGMSKQDVGDAITAAKQAMGEGIGQHIEKADQLLQDGTKDQDLTHLAFTPGELGAKLQTELMTPQMQMPMNSDQKSALEKIIQSSDMIPKTMINGQEVHTFADVQDFVSDLRRKWAASISKDVNDGGVRGIETVSPLDAMKSATYQVAKKALEDRVDQVAIAAKDTDLYGALQTAKKNYAKLAELEKYAANNQARDAGNKLLSLTDNLRMGQGLASGVLAAGGSALGGAVGGFPGALTGQWAGKVLGTPIDLMLKKWGENRGMVYLSNAANQAAKAGPEVFTTVLASDAAKRVQATMSKVGDTLHAMALRSSLPISLKAEKTGIAHLLDGNTQGLSHDQQLSKLQGRITDLATNPAAMAQVSGALTSPFQNVSPELAQAYGDKLSQSMQYLYQSMPKNTQTPQLFAPNYWKPKPGELQAWKDKVEILANPMSALNHLHAGTLSQDHLDALKTVYPSIYQMMQNEIQTFAMKHPDVYMPHRQQQVINKFMGNPTDNQYILALQQKYQTPDQSTQQPQQTAAPPGQTGKVDSSKLAPMASAFSFLSGPNS